MRQISGAITSLIPLCSLVNNRETHMAPPNEIADPLPYARIGKDVLIYPWAKVVRPEVVSIGDSVIIDDFVFIMGGEGIRLGSFVHIASFSSLTGGAEITLEDFAGLSSGVRVFSGNDDYIGGGLTNPTVPTRFRNLTRAPVRIERHAIIGANSVILPGVVIGEGASIGANSLVKSDCEPWGVYAGCPATRRRSREKGRVLQLERQLRQELYDKDGAYIPRSKRE